MTTNINIVVAFVAGLLSFLSPCVFALVPAYIGYLGGRSVAETDCEDRNKWKTFLHGIFFILGFSLVFVLLGVTASAIGGLLSGFRLWVTRIGGCLVVLFGLHMIGVIKIPFLEYDLRPQKLPDRSRGYLSSLLMGVFFSAGWSPCVGPILGAILTLALSGGALWQGTILLSAYSAGLAIPFLVAALAICWVTDTLRRYRNVMRYTQIVMGIILIITGIMLVTGTFEQLARFGYFFDVGI